jgi:hypothetical protein
MRGEDYCYVHHPDYQEERRRHGSRGGRRGGRGRPLIAMQGIADQLQELADKVLSGELERADAAVSGQLLNYKRAAILGGLQVREQLELEQRLEELERVLEQKGNRWRA